MGSAGWIQIAAALLSGSALPFLGRTALRLIRGDVGRAEHAEEVEAKREAAELGRLLEEIAHLRLDRNDKEALVDLMRRQLDQALVRNNTSTTIARILLAAVDAEAAPSRQMIAARDQARSVINTADEQMKREN